jgi:hypothetical protein
MSTNFGKLWRKTMLRIGDHVIDRPTGSLWFVDNVYRAGEIVLGEYVLVRHDEIIDTQVAKGFDPYELLKVADALNASEEKEAA